MNRLAIEVITGGVVLICMVIELIIAFFAAIDFKSLEKAQLGYTAFIIFNFINGKLINVISRFLKGFLVIVKSI